MTLLSVLPPALVALVLASSVFSSPTSTNDPFRAISAQATRQPEPAVCCLVPLPPVEPVEDEVLLSFEQWKGKQAALQASAKATKERDSPGRPNPLPSGSSSGKRENLSSMAENVSLTPADVPDTAAADSSESLNLEKLSPHFQVPLTDRFNYASMDCSARVHLAHRSAKSSASILSSKRDRYMLSPCNSPNQDQFVIVELCEDIRIDTVQLANFEFFSGVFKDFSVSVSKRYTTNEDEWVNAGTYRAKNVRGVQSFHPPPSLSDFYRFIRINFHTHYSNEYYCPVSLLRVYGLTHLEEWKWEIWEAESRAKREELGVVEPSPPVEIVAEEPQPVQIPVSDVAEEKLKATTGDQATSSPSSDESTSTAQKDESASSFVSTIHSSSITLGSFPWEQYATPVAAEAQLPSKSVDTSLTSDDSQSKTSVLTTTTTSTTLIAVSSNDSSSSGAAAGTSSDTSLLSTASTVHSSSLSASSSSPSVITTVHQVHSPPPVTGGESIYRIIMNRLTALEANHSLYVRYVEEQTTGVREMLRRLAEDVGRLDGIGKAQAKKFQRSLTEWENQRNMLESEYNELVARVEYLADEIVLEKRLGIAQLCLLLAVIVFMGLTRGSRGESLVEHGPIRFNRSMREWSRRHLSFSGDWVSRFTLNSSRSRSPQRTAKSAKPSATPQVTRDHEHRVAFPTMSARPKSAKIHTHVSHQSMPDRRPKVQNVYVHHNRSRTHSRTPSLLTPNNPRVVSRPSTPTTSVSTTAFRPQLHRSNSITGSAAIIPASASWSGVGPVPKSAKRWARTAHLHEVKSSAATAADNIKVVKDAEDDDEKENRDFAVPSAAVAAKTSKDMAKSLDDDTMESDFILNTPSRRPRRSNGHLLFTPAVSSVLPVDDKRWTSSPVSCDGEDGDTWVDTDTSVDGDPSSPRSGFGFGYDEDDVDGGL